LGEASGDLPIFFSGVSVIVDIFIEFQSESRSIRDCERATGEGVARSINDIACEGCDFAVEEMGNCFCELETEEEAEKNVLEAIKECLEVRAELGI